MQRTKGLNVHPYSQYLRASPSLQFIFLYFGVSGNFSYNILCQKGITNTCPGLDRIFIRLGPAPPMSPSLLGLPAHVCVGTPSRWEPI